jgi:hypothetical protein
MKTSIRVCMHTCSCLFVDFVLRGRGTCTFRGAEQAGSVLSRETNFYPWNVLTLMYVNWYTYKTFWNDAGTFPRRTVSVWKISWSERALVVEGKPQPLGNALFLCNLVDLLHLDRIFIQDFVTIFQLIQIVFHGECSIALTSDG